MLRQAFEPHFLLVELAAASSAACWVLSLLTREYSWVDRLWSILPPVYLWVVAVQTGLGHPRVLLMAALGTAWGLRLTWNFARKGGYRKGGEDYRWAELRRRIPPGAFRLFNFVFVATFQNALARCSSSPAAADGSGTPQCAVMG